MENRHRKGPYHRQDWRSKAVSNKSNRRYKRDFVLKHYKNLMPPNITCKSEIQEILLTEPNPPLLSAFFPFSHGLGDDPGSRKFPQREKKAEQMPEWYGEEDENEGPKDHPEERQSLDKFERIERIEKLKDNELEDKFSKIDLQVEEKLKKVEEEKEEMPEWDEPAKEDFAFEEIKAPVQTQEPQRMQVPVYKVDLMRYHFAIGNPFVQTLIDFGVPVGENAITFTPGTKPFEKIWYYKDMLKCIQGPFSTLEMFTWTIMDCFPPDLEISLGLSHFFVPMNIINLVPTMPESLYYENSSEKPNHGKAKKDTKKKQDFPPSQSKTGSNKRGK